MGTHASRGQDVGARVLLDAHGVDELLLGTEEAQGKKNQVGRVELLRALDLLHLPLAVDLLPLDAHSVDALELAVLDDKVLGRNAVLAGVLLGVSHDLLVAVVGLLDTGKLGPGVGAGGVS